MIFKYLYLSYYNIYVQVSSVYEAREVNNKVLTNFRANFLFYENGITAVHN